MSVASAERVATRKKTIWLARRLVLLCAINQSPLLVASLITGFNANPNRGGNNQGGELGRMWVPGNVHDYRRSEDDPITAFQNLGHGGVRGGMEILAMSADRIMTMDLRKGWDGRGGDGRL